MLQHLHILSQSPRGAYGTTEPIGSSLKQDVDETDRAIGQNDSRDQIMNAHKAQLKGNTSSALHSIRKSIRGNKADILNSDESSSQDEPELTFEQYQLVRKQKTQASAVTDSNQTNSIDQAKSPLQDGLSIDFNRPITNSNGVDITIIKEGESKKIEDLKIQNNDVATESKTPRVQKKVPLLTKIPTPQTQSLKSGRVAPKMDGDDLYDFVKEGVASKYKSRCAQIYDDSDSAYEIGSDSEDEMSQGGKLSKIELLKQQESLLMQQIEQNMNVQNSVKQQQALGANSDSDVKPNKRFKNFNDLFSGMTKSMNVVTSFPIISVIITYNAKSAITVSRKNDQTYFIKQYNLESYFMTFEEMIGGQEEDYIKLKEVEQNYQGTKYAIAYYNDGIFKIRTFGYTTRTKEEILKEEFNVNTLIDINNYTVPIDNFPDPFINCTFITDDILFVQLFHTYSLTHHHFFLNLSTRNITRHQIIKLDTTNQNFPYKCFYNDEENEVYSFYRQGQSFRIPVLEVEKPQNNGKAAFIMERITDRDLGTMYLINNKALVARASQKILFFKLKLDDITLQKYWENYETLDLQGQIFFIKGNIRMQITTAQKIYFYKIDQKTFEPMLENVMFNFMNCTNMMFGSKVKYCITYKTNQKSFDIFRRKYEHDYKVSVVKSNFTGSQGLPIDTMNAFLVSNIDRILFYDMNSFKEIKSSEIKIPLFQSETRERNEIVAMQKNRTEDILAVISGKNLTMNRQKPQQLFIFERQKNFNTTEMDKFLMTKRIIIKDVPNFDQFSMQFYFKNVQPGRDTLSFLFSKKERIFEYNVETKKIKYFPEFEVSLNRQPEFFIANEEQSVFIIASQEDGIYINNNTQVYVDLDFTFGISNIKEIIHDHEDKVFYLLANKFDQKLGLFLIKFDESDPNNYQFVFKWKNKLDIADADVAIIRNEVKKYKELLVSYKTIYMNTFSIMIVDLSTKVPLTIFRHESFQLWESKVTGFYINKNMEYITINSQGISLVNLGTQHKKIIKTDDGDKMAHSLESINYLIIDPMNFILFEFSGDKKIISIVQQYTKNTAKNGEETEFQIIYRIQIHQLTLRELLLIQSLYVCNTQTDILKLVKDQPKPLVFFKSFLELDGTNMVSILSFDSRSMNCLLDGKNSEYFQSEYPIFYKNKLQKKNKDNKFFFRSAIDNALKNNQIRAINTIIDYIVKFQNNMVSSFLIAKNMNHFLTKGVKISRLLNSNIFSHSFDFDEWPSTHPDDSTYSRPYNSSLFELRYLYNTVFPEPELQYDPTEDDDDIDTRKVYKVSYTINMLPSLPPYQPMNDDGSFDPKESQTFTELCSGNGELEVFESVNFKDLINFKWDTFAKKLHLVGCFFHFLYITLTIGYVIEVYIQGGIDNKNYYLIMMMIGIVYPACYDWFQIYKQGYLGYLKDIGNYSDMVYVWGSIANIIIQYNWSPYDIISKMLMSVIILQQLYKTFFFLRIFQSLSYIVTMLANVIFDLRVFLLFYGILLFLFGQIFAVIGVGNPILEGGLKEFSKLPEDQQGENFPFEEYDSIGLFLGYFISSLRLSLGDFDFDAANFLTPAENHLYWAIWLMIVLLTCIVFLNFIIAEASASYEVVKKSLEAMIYKEKTSLVTEAELMYFKSWKNKSNFPKYIIIRQIDT